jgi:cytochrome c
MKVLKIWLATATAALLVSSASGADRDRGKSLFNDPNLAGASTGKSCRSCHREDSGLEKAAAKKDFKIAGKKAARLEDALNICIERRMKGKPLGPDSPDIADLAAYIKSLKEIAPVLIPKKKTAETGC